MKLKYIPFVIAIFLIVSTNVYARHPSDFLIRNYSIELQVENLEDAFLILNNLPGLNLNSHVNIQSGWGNMELRVNNRDVDMVLSSLRSLGQVRASNNRSQNVFNSISELQLEFEVRSDQHSRLMDLLYQVDTLDNFMVIENRLIPLINEIEQIRGNLNYFNLEAATTRIHITVFATDSVIAEEPLGAFERIGNAFVSSAGGTLAVIQWMLIFFVYISVPATIVAIIFCIYRFGIRKRRKIEQKGKIGEQNEVD
ncbi:MAG: DUF4349 domain-containing protein [Defluviitaleaceae bacterium]|nr:DUF4349 domain-containing protein [Defluviitaleaceae bacterium]